MATALRILMAVGAYGEAADETRGTESTTLAVRLKYQGQGEDITDCFPGTYVSAVTDPRSISIVGPSSTLQEVFSYVREQEQLQAQRIDVRGKLHNPENQNLAAALSKLCDETPSLQLPDASKLQAPVLSNRTGKALTEGSLSKELVVTILASRCEWYTVLVETVKDLKNASVDAPNVVYFGLTDVVSTAPFLEKGLRLTKTAAHSLIPRIPRVLPSKDTQESLGDSLSMVSGTSMVCKAYTNTCIAKQSSKRSTNGHSYLYPENAVAVIGASARLPGARNIDELWELLAKGEDRHEKLSSDRFDLYNSFRVSQSAPSTKSREYFGNFVEGVDRFDHAFFGINAREMLNMDPQQRMLLELSYEAMESSGYTRSHVRSRGDPVGCFIGASFVEYLDNTNAYAPTAYTSSGTIRAFLCGRLSYHFGWSGPAEIIDTACSSSLVAINRAVKAVQSGECSMALTGGVNLITGMNNFLDLGKAGFLSPTGQCKPFDKNADGYCRSEGAGLIVLKPLKQAQLDGDRIMGVIVGSATNQGGLSDGLTVPSSHAQKNLYRSLLKQADLAPEHVTYVEAHGTGTQAGDPLEIASIRSVFGSETRASEIQVGSIKGNIGHCETAAGVAGVLKIICMLQHQAIPPQASHKVWNPKIPALGPDRMAISTSLKDWNVPFRAALVNSYGAAGSNAAILCCEPPQPPSKPVQHESRTQPSATWPIILSAKTASSLRRYKDSLAAYLTKTPQLPISSVAGTLSEKRQRHKHYTVFEASSTADLIQSLTSGESQKPVLEQGAPKSVVLTFGGQSKQTVGLDRGFYDQFSAFRATLDDCNNILQGLGYPSILPAVFDTENIADIVVLQSGFVAVQYAMATTWIRAGLKVDAVVGHSLGELTALAVSRKLSIQDCLKLVAARASLMKSKWGPDNGSMLAVFSSREVVRDLILNTGLEIACYNSDTSQVVTGEISAMSNLQTQLASRSPPIKYLKVDTSHAFHSRLVDPVLGELDQVAASLEWREPTIRIEFCTDAQKKPDAPYSPSEHARNPVFLVDAVRRLEKTLGSCVFLEASMNTPIVSMVKRAVARPDTHSFIALSTKDTEYSPNLISRTVCALWSSSIDVTHWPLVEQDNSVSYTWLPPYQFEPTTGWLDNVDRAAIFQSQLNQVGVSELNQANSTPEKLRMVRLLPNPDGGKKTQRFRVLVEGDRFKKIVAGHAVRNRPLCPASVYLECVTMALSIVAGDPKNSSLDFQGLDIQAPLGLRAENVEVILEEVSPQSSWSFKVVSNDRKETLHARGRVNRSSGSKLDAAASSHNNHAFSLANNADAERMLSRRLYSLFSRVVSYETFLRGVSDITMSGTKAVARIVTPPSQPGVEESTAVQVCDAVTLDNFIQVIGLLINTSDLVDVHEVMVCTGVDSSVVARDINMVNCRSWKVHASYTATSSSQALGDVFAFSEDGSLAAALTGCRFSKLEITRLEKLLDPVNQATSEQAAQPQLQNRSAPVPSVVKSEVDLSEALASSNGPVSSVKPPSPAFDNAIRQIIETYTGLEAAEITGDAILGDLGLDSLAAIEMAEELRSAYQITIDGMDLLNISVKQLEEKVYGAGISSSEPTSGDESIEPNSLATSAATSVVPSAAASVAHFPISPPNEKISSNDTRIGTALAAGLLRCEAEFEKAAASKGYQNYWADVAVKQDTLTLVYILEAFQKLGVDFASLKEGEEVPAINYQPSHGHLFKRLREILVKHDIVKTEGGDSMVRTSKPISFKPSAQLHEELLQQYPRYAIETQLMALTGPKLAECLTGEVDPLSLLFGSRSAGKILEEYYGQSPMLATMTSQLVTLISAFAKQMDPSTTLRILEVGAGTGGTTAALAARLADVGIKIEYTFTDIGSTMVAKAKKRFSGYNWMSFERLDLEQPAPSHLQGKFDIAIGTNCVHATKDKIATTSRIREMLNANGFMVLSEVTRIVDWYDLVFGLLEGWWLADGGATYPLQPPETWMNVFKEAGFASTTYSGGSCEEANTQNLLIGSNRIIDSHPGY